MEKLIIEIIGMLFKNCIGTWTRGTKKEIVGENISGWLEFGQTVGLTFLQAKKLDRTIEEFIDDIAEDFLKNFGNELENVKQNKLIKQAKNDIKKVCKKEDIIYCGLNDIEKFKELILSESEETRKKWIDKENKIYKKYVDYFVKTSIRFFSKLPEFTPQTLYTIVERQEKYHKELKEILDEIHSMTSILKSVDETFREYEKFYRERIVDKYNNVELIGANFRNRKVNRYDISAAYVELNCINDDYEEEIALSDVFLNGNVAWIKGEAGCGKTTFLQWVAVCSAKGEYKKIKNIRNTVPIIIGLRSIEWPINLQNIIDVITNSLGKSCPEGWLVQLLERGRIILLFDGFDEIAIDKRIKTYNFIEDILKKYPKIKILMTARNSVKDDIEGNIHYEIVPMKIENIKKFILYWHKAVLQKDAIDDDDKIEKIQYELLSNIIENPSLKILAKNPLLCAMICALNYVNNGQLPENKMELYEKCCEMLLDSRDNGRKISSTNYENVPKLDYSRKRKILEEIAYWMMNAGVSAENRKNVENFIEHLLKDTNILLESKQQYTGKDLLDFFVERSGMIREPEVGVIDFVHKTFMEFLAVKAICRNYAWSVLIKEACNENWKETIIMCFSEMGKESTEFVLNGMLKNCEEEHDERYVLMAALGIAQAIFLTDNTLKEKVDNELKKLIPPNQKNMYELVELGVYILPFLKDSINYNNSEKNRCLMLLDHMDAEEAIPVVLSYIEGNGSYRVKQKALEILCKYPEEILYEYNVKDTLFIAMKNSIKNNEITVSSTLINLLEEIEISDNDKKIFRKIYSIKVIFEEEQELYIEYDFLENFKYCQRVVFCGKVRYIDLLEYFLNIEELKIDTSVDFTKEIQILESIQTLKSIKKFSLIVKKLNYICHSDLLQMKKLENFYLKCYDQQIDFDLIDFSNMPNLKKITFEMPEWVIEEIKGNVLGEKDKQISYLKIPDEELYENE